MFKIRLATIDDIKKVFELSNDDIVRANSINQAKIKWKEHDIWFKNKITSSDSVFYVAYESGVFIGYCRLDKDKNNDWIVTIHLTPSFRGKGYGSIFLTQVCEKNKEKNIIAFVKVLNKPSCNLFKKSNFIEIDKILLDNIEYFKFQYIKTNYVIAISNTLYNSTKIFNKKNITYIRQKEELNYEILKKLNPKYVFFPHWSYIISPEIFENFNCIIFHMTDLPFGRGGSPLQNLIERGIKRTKISAIKCVKELDAGDIYLKRDLDISYGSAREIYIRAGEIISEMIEEIITNNPEPVPQVGEIVEFKRRKPEQSSIKYLSDIEKIYDYIRMLDADGYPKAFLENNNLIFDFSNAKLENNKIFASVEIKVKNHE